MRPEKFAAEEEKLAKQRFNAELSSIISALISHEQQVVFIWEVEKGKVDGEGEEEQQQQQQQQEDTKAGQNKWEWLACPHPGNL